MKCTVEINESQLDILRELHIPVSFNIICSDDNEQEETEEEEEDIDSNLFEEIGDKFSELTQLFYQLAYGKEYDYYVMS